MRDREWCGAVISIRKGEEGREEGQAMVWGRPWGGSGGRGTEGGGREWWGLIKGEGVVLGLVVHRCHRRFVVVALLSSRCRRRFVIVALSSSRVVVWTWTSSLSLSWSLVGCCSPFVDRGGGGHSWVAVGAGRRCLRVLVGAWCVVRGWLVWWSWLEPSLVPWGLVWLVTWHRGVRVVGARG